MRASTIFYGSLSTPGYLSIGQVYPCMQKRKQPTAGFSVLSAAVGFYICASKTFCYCWLFSLEILVILVQKNMCTKMQPRIKWISSTCVMFCHYLSCFLFFFSYDDHIADSFSLLERTNITITSYSSSFSWISLKFYSGKCSKSSSYLSRKRCGKCIQMLQSNGFPT